ncbi:MAG: hypothetical protein QOG64_2763, partial [Acidimicrobiaceae bacterium]|nr:hypothetical protein [Acidimicrobiaceae bacterium]
GVPRLDLDDLPAGLAEALRPRVERLGYLGEFFRVAGNQPEALAGFVAYTEACKAALPPRLTELIALTVSTATGSAYERHQHERLALELGFGEAWVRAVVEVDPLHADGLDAVERAVQPLVLRLVDGIGRDASAEMAAVEAVLTAPELVAVLLTVGRYLAHAVVVNAMALAPPVPSPLAPPPPAPPPPPASSSLAPAAPS